MPQSLCTHPPSQKLKLKFNHHQNTICHLLCPPFPGFMTLFSPYMLSFQAPLNSTHLLVQCRDTCCQVLVLSLASADVADKLTLGRTQLKQLLAALELLCLQHLLLLQQPLQAGLLCSSQPLQLGNLDRHHMDVRIRTQCKETSCGPAPMHLQATPMCTPTVIQMNIVYIQDVPCVESSRQSPA